MILKIASICTAFGAVSLFFRYSPFPVWHKILFMAGVLPLYEYSVVTRNYGISMLLFFLFAALYPKRKESPFILAFVLALLANTNAHSCLLVVLLTIFWFWNDLVVDRQLQNRRRIAVLAGALLIIGAGIVGAAATSFPEPGTAVTGVHFLNASQVLEALWMNIRHPGENFRNLFAESPLLLRDLLLWLLIAGLLIRRHAAVVLSMGIFLMGTFFLLVYEGYLRHEGILLVFIVSCYWIVHEQISDQPGLIHNRYLGSVYKLSFYLVLPIIFTLQIMMSYDFIKTDINQEMSSSRAFAGFLNSNRHYQQAIIMGEPDFYLESLPYYASNPIFIPREGKWRKYVKFTSENRERFSLGELLNMARMVNGIERKPVLIALGHLDLAPLSGGEISYSYNKIFTWSLQELAEFRANTIKVAGFRSALTDENYDVYLLR